MSRLRALYRTTAVRLSALYLVLFALCAAVLVIYVTAMSGRLLSEQTRDAVTLEVAQINDIYNRAGVSGLLRTLERRARQPGANLYVIAGPTGEILAGNVAGVEPGLLASEGWTEEPFFYTRYGEETRADRGPHVALAQVFFLPNGLRILVGRDLQEPEKFRVLVRQALMLALGIMGGGALVIWFAIGRSTLRRIDRMSDASKRIMAGDLSQRLPASGSGDEFDRLSASLNAMLGRIEKLNEGLRHVSDNIAHDLKTPLTRLRNKAEAALAQRDANYRAALEEIIGESDQLIRTFNALLMISRVEAGSSAAEMTVIDLSQIAADTAELYEALAEDQGSRLETAIAPGILVRGNRELIGQALANLLDNAIKYAEGAETPVIRVVLEAREREALLSVSDHGPGVPAGRRDDVVRRFVRLDESRSKPGTGLGLSLVQAVMELHGGSLRLADTAPEGDAGRGLTASMVFRLPG
ncbi:sensor histidine kinase [Ensifer soli]|uniref:sensor histidine kinase n=1 Tax=Ciceribacter sp. sgz301302 TaxID=3342379 RepID=UPI0035B9E75C